MSADPTRTVVLRKSFAAAIRRRWLIASKRARAKLADRLSVNSITEFGLSEEEQVALYEEWLRSIIEEEFSESDQWIFLFVLAAYTRGVKMAKKDLDYAGYDSREMIEAIAEVDDLGQRSLILSSPTHRKEFTLMLMRVRNELKGQKSAVIQAAVSVLLDGIAAGDTGSILGKKVSESITDTGYPKAKFLAFDAIIRIFAEAMLTTFALAGITDVMLEPEVVFATAGDGKVCKRCSHFEGMVYTISEARGLIPLHPFCRCRWILRR